MTLANADDGAQKIMDARSVGALTLPYIVKTLKDYPETISSLKESESERSKKHQTHARDEYIFSLKMIGKILKVDTNKNN